MSVSGAKEESEMMAQENPDESAENDKTGDDKQDPGEQDTPDKQVHCSNKSVAVRY